jgi:hypothetical protein
MVAGAAQGATIRVVCSTVDGHAINFTIDTTAKKVSAGMIQATDVNIDEGDISFYLTLKDSIYWHQINRNTGDMQIRDPKGTIITGYHCEPAKPKF